MFTQYVMEYSCDITSAHCKLFIRSAWRRRSPVVDDPPDGPQCPIQRPGSIVHGGPPQLDKVSRPAVAVRPECTLNRGQLAGFGQGVDQCQPTTARFVGVSDSLGCGRAWYVTTCLEPLSRSSRREAAQIAPITPARPNAYTHSTGFWLPRDVRSRVVPILGTARDGSHVLSLKQYVILASRVLPAEPTHPSDPSPISPQSPCEASLPSTSMLAQTTAAGSVNMEQSSALRWTISAALTTTADALGA